MNARLSIAAACGLAAAYAPLAAHADKIKHPMAVFAGLDKITGRVIAFEATTDETVQFGSLQVTPRVCYTRPPTEAPQTDAFVQVDEVETDNKFKQIFSGWMFAASPGLNAVEHPVYDVWLTDCKGGTQVAPETASLPEDAPTAPALLPSAPKPAARQAARPSPNLGQPAPPDQPYFPPAAQQAPSRPRTTAGAAPPRRTPSQSFFPTAASPGPGDSPRERELQ